MRLPISIGLLAGIALATTAVAAEPQPSAKSSATSLRDNLLSSFFEICLENRGKWEDMQAAAEASSFNFKKQISRNGKEIDYIDHLLWVAMKKRKRSKHICLAQSLIEDNSESAVSNLFALLKESGHGLEQAVFVPTKQGVIAEIPRGTVIASRKTKREFVKIILSPSPIADSSVVLFTIYAK